MAYQFTQTGQEIQDILDQVGTNTGDIAQNTQDIGTLNTNLTNISNLLNQTPTTPSVISSRVTNTYGGYIKVGTLVFVSINTQANVNFSGATNIFTGLPKPAGNRPLIGCNFDSNTTMFAYVDVNGNVNIKGAGTTSGQRMGIMGSYFTT